MTTKTRLKLLTRVFVTVLNNQEVKLLQEKLKKKNALNLKQSRCNSMFFIKCEACIINVYTF